MAVVQAVRFWVFELPGRRGESLSLFTVARELGVTAATACDSVSALAAKGLIRKQRSTTEGRSLALVLTDEGETQARELRSLPDPLWGAVDALADNEQQTLYRLSIKMIQSLQENGALPTSRMCLRCKFFDPFRYMGSASCRAPFREETTTESPPRLLLIKSSAPSAKASVTAQTRSGIVVRPRACLHR
jgi:DNA-binding MarR family transcriptional regulator